MGLTLQGKGLADSFAVCMKLSLVAIASQVSVELLLNTTVEATTPDS